MQYNEATMQACSECTEYTVSYASTGVKRCRDLSVSPSVCLSVLTHVPEAKTVRFRHMEYETPCWKSNPPVSVAL